MSDAILTIKITVTTSEGGRVAGRMAAQRLARQVLKTVAADRDVIGCDSTIEVTE